jgi:hypothetical protein
MSWDFYVLQCLSTGDPFSFFDNQGCGVSLERGDISPFSGTNLIRVSLLSEKGLSDVIDFHFPFECAQYLQQVYPLKSAEKVDPQKLQEPQKPKQKVVNGTHIFL